MKNIRSDIAYVRGSLNPGATPAGICPTRERETHCDRLDALSTQGAGADAITLQFPVWISPMLCVLGNTFLSMGLLLTSPEFIGTAAG